MVVVLSEEYMEVDPFLLAQKVAKAPLQKISTNVYTLQFVQTPYFAPLLSPGHGQLGNAVQPQ